MGLDLKHKAGRLAFETALKAAYSQVGKDRIKTVSRMFHLMDQFKETNKDADNATLEAIMEPDSALGKFVDKVIAEVDPGIVIRALLNFGYESMTYGWEKSQKNVEKYHCNIPFGILIDPTTACNLRCTGCWAAEYGNALSLSYDEIDSVITQGKELGTYTYLFTGGEPLTRKADIIKLAEKHYDCSFIVFTNGTLVDEKFCEDLLRVKNVYPALSLEGYEEKNDQRRGQGVFEKVMHAMDLMREHKLLFGNSICYTSANMEVVTSDKFIDMILEKGSKFGMYFHYMPVGTDAAVELLPTKEQREYMLHRIHQVRDPKDGKGFFCFDFQNDGELVNGCIAGGRRYFHINANGDAEPCVFIHYSNMNIREHSILEILQSPIFMEYYRNQPFNKNLLKPCPMLENPEILPQMVKRAGAKSTDLQSPETAEQLCAKCVQYSKNWAPEAEELNTVKADMTRKEEINREYQAQQAK